MFNREPQENNIRLPLPIFEIDWDKITSVEDLKLIMKEFQVKVSPAGLSFDRLQDKLLLNKPHPAYQFIKLDD